MRNDIIRRLILLLVVALVAMTPWVRATSYASDAAAIILGGAALALAVGLSWPALCPRRVVLPLLLLGLFVLWSGVVGEWGLAPFHSEQRWATWVAALAVAAACSLLRGRDLPLVGHGMVASATALTAYGLQSWVQAYRAAGAGETLPRLTATYTNPDCLAALLLMALALAMGLAAGSKALELMWLTLASLVLCVGLLLTQCRSAWLGAAVASAVLLVWCARSGWRSVARVAVAPLAGAVALGIVITRLTSGSPLDKLWIFLDPSRGHDVGLKGDLAVRSVVWHGLRPMFAHYGLWGAGLDNFHLAFQQWHPPGAADVYINQAHCDPIQVLVETGLLGFLLLAAACLAAVWRAWQAARWRGPAALGAAAGLVGLGLFSLFNFAIPVAADLVWMGALIGLCGAFGKPPSGRGPEPDVRVKAFPAAIMVAVACLAGWIGNGTARVAALETRVREMAAQYQWRDALAASQAAVAWEPRNEALYMERAGLRFQLGQSSGDAAQVAGAMEDVQTALRLNRRAKDLALQAAAIYQEYGDLATAEQILSRDASDNPRDFRVWDVLGRVQSTAGRLTEAAESFRRERQEAPYPQGPLADTLAYMEVQEHSGAALLQQWLSRASRDRADLLAVGESAAALCQGSKESAVRFYQVLVAADPGNDQYQQRLLQLSRPAP